MALSGMLIGEPMRLIADATPVVGRSVDGVLKRHHGPRHSNGKADVVTDRLGAAASGYGQRDLRRVAEHPAVIALQAEEAAAVDVRLQRRHRRGWHAPGPPAEADDVAASSRRINDEGHAARGVDVDLVGGT